jgi:hypothetical protein
MNIYPFAIIYANHEIYLISLCAVLDVDEPAWKSDYEVLFNLDLNI